MGGHDHAIDAPRPGLRGKTEQTDAVGRRGMGSKKRMSLTIGRRQRTGTCSERKAAHRHIQATQGSTQAGPKLVQAAQGSMQAAQGQCVDNVQVAYRQCVLATRTLANDGTWLGLRRGALKNPLGKLWEWHHAPSTE